MNAGDIESLEPLGVANRERYKICNVMTVYARKCTEPQV